MKHKLAFLFVTLLLALTGCSSEKQEVVPTQTMMLPIQNGPLPDSAIY